jgi:quaternary ammonium compound-resistance protein SugE
MAKSLHGCLSISFMAWFILVIAGFFEVGFTTCLAKAKESNGSAYVWWLIGFIVSMTMSMFLLYKATLTLPMGTAYAVWTGIGAAGTAIVGILFFKEPAQIWRMFFLFTLIASIIGLKYVTH